MTTKFTTLPFKTVIEEKDTYNKALEVGKCLYRQDQNNTDDWHGYYDLYHIKATRYNNFYCQELNMYNGTKVITWDQINFKDYRFEHYVNLIIKLYIIRKINKNTITEKELPKVLLSIKGLCTIYTANITIHPTTKVTYYFKDYPFKMPCVGTEWPGISPKSKEYIHSARFSITKKIIYFKFNPPFDYRNYQVTWNTPYVPADESRYTFQQWYLYDFLPTTFDIFGQDIPIGTRIPWKPIL